MFSCCWNIWMGTERHGQRNWPLGPCTVMSSHAVSLRNLLVVFCGRNFKKKIVVASGRGWWRRIRKEIEERERKRLVGSRSTTGYVLISMKSSTDRRTYTHTVGGFQVCRSARFQFQMRPDRLGCVAFVCLSVCKMGEEGSKISNERGWRLQMFLRLYFHHSDNQTHLLSQIYLNGFDEDPKAFSLFFSSSSYSVVVCLLPMT
jgi:hypothetical protein